jgi:hypothetical protein
MLNKVIFAACALALSTSPLLAGHHKGPMGPPPAGIMIPLPGGAMMPAPEEGPDKLADFVFDHLDKDGDGKISKDELRDALKGGMPHHGDEKISKDELRDVLKDGMPHHGDGDSDGDSDGEMSGISEGDEGLESLPHPEECGETLTSSEMGPIAEGVSCGSSDSVGNQLNRTVCNLAPYNSNAISMPEGRAADCFRIAAIKGNNITFEIVKESDGSVIFDTSMGTTAFDRLVLIGEPGDTVYRINLTGADEADASVTLEFIDHPMF